ncbi:hypothetical protein ADUPG1_003889, partial [Aduncisulcus paluster]
MEAALQKEKRSLANLTKVVFSQLQIVKESREDTAQYQGYSQSTSKKFHKHDSRRELSSFKGTNSDGRKR